jgi:hypothetical protein
MDKNNEYRKGATRGRFAVIRAPKRAWDKEERQNVAPL